MFKTNVVKSLLLIAIVEMTVNLIGYNTASGSQQTIPNKTGQVFVVDNWDNKITKNDLGFNYFSGNTGAVERVKGTTSITVSNNSNGSVGGSLDISYAFTGADDEYAGYFASLFGLTDTKISLDGNSAEPNTSTPFPGYFLDTQDIYRGFSKFPNRSVEELRFDVLLESGADITLKIELKDEPNDGNDFDVFAYRTIADTNGTWQTISLRIPEDFNRSVKGEDDTNRFNWRQVSTFAIIVEHHNIGNKVNNPDNGRFLIDNLVLVDTDGNYPDINQIQSPTSGELDPNYQNAFLDLIRATSCLYFLDWASTDPRTGGIVQDRSTFADLMTVGGVGFQLSSYVIDAKRGYLPREDAALRVRNILEVLYNHPQGTDRIGTIGYKGFFYHFLGIDGLRKLNFDFNETVDINESLNTVELSTIDTALAIAGVVTAGQYFNGSSDIEKEIKDLADRIYARVDWKFMLDDNRFTNTKQFFLGWKPNESRDDDSGRFGRYKLNDDPCNPKGQYSSKEDSNGVEIPATLDYYTDEGLLIALLAMGSPDPNHRLGREVWDAMIRGDENGLFVKTYPGSLFTYQFASVWLNTQWLGTDNHPSKPVNFFENTRQAIQATRNYAIVNPKDRATLNDNRWGLSATEGPFDSYFAEAAPSAAIHPEGNEPMAYVFGSPILLEGENGTGDADNIKYRTNASGDHTRWLDSGETSIIDFNLSGTAKYELKVRYSNDGPSDVLQLSIDDIPAGSSFITQDTRPAGGVPGSGWNEFALTNSLGDVNLAPGHHNLTVTVLNADFYGVEVDVIILEPKPILRLLEVGTVTNYGIGCSVVHTPNEAVAGLWNNAQHEDLDQDGTPDLLHPRFGFADAFNLNVSDAVIEGTVHPNEPWILRADGPWVNYTGFAIDHGPMLIMIDNYLNRQFIPRLFMSHPNIRDALSELFIFGSLQVTKCTVTAGSKAGSDKISFSGTMDAAASDFNDVNVVKVTIVSDDIVNPCVLTFPINSKTFKKGRYSYSGTENGARKSFTYNPKTGKFSFAAANVVLSGLSCPLTVQIEIGDYNSTTDVDEMIVNGPRIPIPIKLMMGVKDVLRVDKCQVKHGKKLNTDQLSVSGAFAVEDPNMNMANRVSAGLVITLGARPFTIPANKLKAGKGKFTCSKADVNEGGTATAKFNFNMCSFTLTIKKSTTITADSGDVVDFGVAFSGYNRVDQVTLP